MMDTATHKSRIGIYGGTFDPFHMGHLHALRAFDAAIHPDAIWLVPTYLPPHKTHRPTDDPAQRLAMLRALCASDTLSGLPCRVEPYEIEKAGKSYTYDTLRHFARADRILYFLLGTDMFCTLPQWHRGAELFALAHMVCIRRGGAEEEQEKQRIAAAAQEYRTLYDAQITILSAVPFALSSTQIREKAQRGESLQGLVPPVIEKMIQRSGYYRG